MTYTCKVCNKSKEDVSTFKTGRNEYVSACKSCQDDLRWTLRCIGVSRAQYAGVGA